ncbi:hypothetical protein SAMN05216360_11075 [Methylobacterium phyllostachyos]|uniref:Uncharacterized protein n=1 Tax=Methylobacterium phyllostachyos TaxID=582672 RepID=A0A1H0D9L1_9HYPH|nr:hypothetical protein [Methylobacterium phyllostachyos]SDN66842.1 hypothetical protein SAMN05216360_11075 [Methylobacterium phyllostachyos]
MARRDTTGAETGSGEGAAKTLARRLHAFRSLGDNCEFGFVQRYGGVEPSGLLRFSYTPLEDLIRGLRCGFADFGVPGDLRLSVSAGGTYYCHSRAYNIWANTGHPAGSIAPEVLLEREYGRLAHLKRKFLDELADGSKILVRKVGRDEPESGFARLAEAVWAHGPSTLLRVTEAGPAWAAEAVRRVGERLIEGRVRRFAPVEQAWAVDLEPWLYLVDGAYALVQDAASTRLDADAFPEALALSGRLRRHVGRHREPALSAFTRAVEPGGFRGDAVYVFSCWVWIPEDFAGTRVFATAGYTRLGWRDADLSQRNCWQRVWAAGRLRPDAVREPVGLGMIGTRRDGFWSIGARFAEGPIPGDAPEPALPRPPARIPGWDLLARLRPRFP